MDGNKEEQSFIHVGLNLDGPARGRDPGWGRYAVLDHHRKLVRNRASVGMEYFGLNLDESVPNLFGFFRESHGEIGFELADELWNDVGLKEFDVAEREQ